MDNMGRRTLTSAIRVFDLFLLTVSFGVAALPMVSAHGHVSFNDFLSLRIKIQNFVVFFISVVGLAYHFPHAWPVQLQANARPQSRSHRHH